MKWFVILLCIVIGSVLGELERRQFGKRKLKVIEDATEIRSYISHIDGKDLHSSDDNDHLASRAKDVNSADQITEINPLPVIQTPTVKPSYSRASKNNMEIMQFGESQKYLKMFHRITKPEDSGTKKKTLIDFFKKFLRDANAHSRREANRVSKAKTSHRRKRQTGAVLPAAAEKSLAAYKTFRDKLPEKLGQQIDKTDKLEEKLLQNYVKSKDFAPDDLFVPYDESIKEERAILKQLAESAKALDKAKEIINNYKAMRKGWPPWNFIQLRPEFKDFFSKAKSNAYYQYKSIKKDENQFADFYIGAESGGSAPSGDKSDTKSEDTGAEASEKPSGTNESEKPKEEEAKKESESDKPKEEEAKKESESDKPKEEEAKKPTEGEKPKEEEANTGLNDGTSELDKKLWDKVIDDHIGYDWTCMRSLSLYEEGMATLDIDLQNAMKQTDNAEKDLLNFSKDAKAIQKKYLDIYYECRRNEIQVLKEYRAKYTKKAKDRILFNYEWIRRGRPWNWLKDHVMKDFFHGNVPKSVVDEYLNIKKYETATTQYLDGTWKIGDRVKEVEDIIFIHKEVSPAPDEEENVEEMKRGLRVKETETVEVEYDAYRENVIATSDVDAKGDAEVHGSADNATETTTDTKHKRSNHLLRFGILLGMVSQFITAILILTPQRDKLAQWCKGRKKTESSPSETESLQAGEKVFAVGPTSKPSKSPLNATLQM